MLATRPDPVREQIDRRLHRLLMRNMGYHVPWDAEDWWEFAFSAIHWLLIIPLGYWLMLPISLVLVLRGQASVTFRWILFCLILPLIHIALIAGLIWWVVH